MRPSKEKKTNCIEKSLRSHELRIRKLLACSPILFFFFVIVVVLVNIVFLKAFKNCRFSFNICGRCYSRCYSLVLSDYF